MEHIINFLGILIPLGLVGLGYAIGHAREKAHLRNLENRERIYQEILLTNLEGIPEGYEVQDAFLCQGSVVIASDYFKTFIAGIMNLIGGHLRTLETLFYRARREALLRMAEEARAKGANLVLNIRYETMMIRFTKRKAAVPMAEMMAYGTAIRLSPLMKETRQDNGVGTSQSSP